MGESVRGRCFDDQREVAGDNACPLEVLEKHAHHAAAISNTARSKARPSFRQKATHHERRQRVQVLQVDAFQKGIKCPEVMDVLLDRFVVETAFLTKIREELWHLVQEWLVWEAATTPTDKSWDDEPQHLLNRPPQVSGDVFSDPFDGTTTAIGAMHPEIDKRLDVGRQLRMVGCSLTLCKRPEIEQERHTLREIAR
jgi:hypothetical protein